MTNTTYRAHLPALSFGGKLKRLYNRAFVLPEDALQFMCAAIEGGGWNEAKCIEHIDNYGDWLEC